MQAQSLTAVQVRNANDKRQGNEVLGL